MRLFQEGKGGFWLIGPRLNPGGTQSTQGLHPALRPRLVKTRRKTALGHDGPCFIEASHFAQAFGFYRKRCSRGISTYLACLATGSDSFHKLPPFVLYARQYCHCA